MRVSLDPMSMAQLAMGIISEIHVVMGDVELVVTKSTTFKAHQEALDSLKTFYNQMQVLGIASSPNQGDN